MVLVHIYFVVLHNPELFGGVIIGTVGIEVALGDILTSKESKKATHPLELAVGRDIKGQALMLNLATTPHLLIAGATGAGKSSCINAMVTSVLMRTTPELRPPSGENKLHPCGRGPYTTVFRVMLFQPVQKNSY